MELISDVFKVKIMRSRQILMVLFATLLTGLTPATTSAQAPSLQPSSQLIFTADLPGQDVSILASMGKDSKIVPFYTDPGLEPTDKAIEALKWSPQGDLLAVLRIAKHPMPVE